MEKEEKSEGKEEGPYWLSAFVMQENFTMGCPSLTQFRKTPQRQYTWCLYDPGTLSMPTRDQRSWCGQVDLSSLLSGLVAYHSSCSLALAP